MKTIVTLLLVLLLTVAALAQVSAPQVPVTGNLGPGGVFPLFNHGTITMTSDTADYNMTPNYDVTAMVLRVISSVTLTTTHNVIVPSNTLGWQFTVENATTGGQSIVFKGTTGSGVTIPNGQTMLVMSDGTNFVVAAGGMIWPAAGAGIPNYTGSSAWGITYSASNPIPFNFLNASVPLAGSCPANTYQNASSNTGPTCSQVQYGQLSGTVPTWNQNTTGNAATATALSSAGTANQVWGMDSTGSTQGWRASSGTYPSGQVVLGAGTGVPATSGPDLAYSGGNLSIGPIGGGAGILTLNGGTSGNVQLIPSATANTLQLNGSAYTTLLVPGGSLSAVSISDSAVNTGLYFPLTSQLGMVNAGTVAWLLGNGVMRCNSNPCVWGATGIGSSQTFEGGLDSTATGQTTGAALFKSAGLTGGTSSGGGTGNATVQSGDNAATGGASQSIGNVIVTSGGFTGATGATAAWTPGYVIIQQKYWSDAGTITPGALACFTTPGTNGQMPRVSNCTATSNVAWIGVISGTQGQAVGVIKSGHAAGVLSNAAVADPAGSFVCVDTTNASKVVVQTTLCAAGQGVGIIDETGSGGTSHSVDVGRY